MSNKHWFLEWSRTCLHRMASFFGSSIILEYSVVHLQIESIQFSIYKYMSFYITGITEQKKKTKK